MSADPRAAQFVVRSLRPEIAGPAIRGADDARSAAIERLDAWTTERFPDFEPRAFMHFDGSFAPVGFGMKCGTSRPDPLPVGLRWDAKSKAIVPAKRTDEGKALERELGTLAFSYPLIDGLGGIVHATKTPPGTPSHLARSFFTGWTFFDLGEQVFAAIGLPHLDDRSALAVINEGDRWAIVRLSAFHLALEQVAS